MAPTLRRSTRVASKRAAPDSTSQSPPPAKKAKASKTKNTETKIKTKTVAAKVSKLSIDGDIPNVILKDEDGEDVDLKKVASENKVVVIFAYPRASTPGCTKQVCGFRDNYPQFTSKKVKVFGLSADSVKAQKNFHTKQHLTYQLLSDPNFELLEPLGAKKQPRGVIRSHWIFVNGKLKIIKSPVSPLDSFTGALDQIKEFVDIDDETNEKEKDEKVGDENGKVDEKKTEETKDEEKKEETKKEEANGEKANGEEAKKEGTNGEEAKVDLGGANDEETKKEETNGEEVKVDRTKAEENTDKEVKVDDIKSNEESKIEEPKEISIVEPEPTVDKKVATGNLIEPKSIEA